jgi:hypothetical protein
MIKEIFTDANLIYRILAPTLVLKPPLEASRKAGPERRVEKMWQLTSI